MERTLPPLNALKTFEAAARHLSFTKAANELLVSQAAVSHQVRHLSEYLNVPLFKRTAAGLELTSEAEQLFDVTKRSLDNISSATENILNQKKEDESCLTVRVTPFFAKHLLAPLISKFLRKYPTINLRTTIGRHPLGNDLGANDVVICTDEGDWEGIDAYPVLSVGMLPLCSPSLMEGENGKMSPDELVDHVIVRDIYADVCGKWLSAAGLKGVEPTRNIFTDDPHFAVEAGVNGQGICFESPIFVNSLITSGQLLMPCGNALSVPLHYRILHTASSSRKEKVKAFRGWLVREMAEYQAAA